jgi:hypothetical protein
VAGRRERFVVEVAQQVLVGGVPRSQGLVFTHRKSVQLD